jgi:hypothetical protein
VTVPCTETIALTRVSKSDEAIEEDSPNISIVPEVFVRHHLPKYNVHTIAIPTGETMGLIENIVVQRMEFSDVTRTTPVEGSKGY